LGHSEHRQNEFLGKSLQNYPVNTAPLLTKRPEAALGAQSYAVSIASALEMRFPINCVSMSCGVEW